MEQNTGNKLATRVIITKTLAGKQEERQYAVGRYVSGSFVALSSAEVARLSDADYQSCVYDTKRYVAQAEGIDDIDGIFLNEPLSKDVSMCPIEAENNRYNFSLTVEDGGHAWSGITPMDNDVYLRVTYPDKPVPTASKFLLTRLSTVNGEDSYVGGYTRFFTPGSVESIGFTPRDFPITAKIVHVGNYVDESDPNFSELLNMKDSDSEYQYGVSPNVVSFTPEKPIFIINIEYKVENGLIYARAKTDLPVKSDIEFYIGATGAANKYFILSANSTESEWILCRANSTTEFVAVNVNLHLVGGEKTRFDNFYRYVVEGVMWDNGINKV